MNALISNYINGNLTSARLAAKRFSYAKLLCGLQAAGYGPRACIAIASYLKGQGTFQAACDAEQYEKVLA